MTEYKHQFEKPKITPAFKKRILKDWQVCFPNLVIKPPLSLSRRVGPLLISVGFDIRRGQERYKPGCGVHNLCNEIDFLTATLGTDLEGSPSSITVRAHEDGRYIEAAERMRNQAPLPLKAPISLNMIIKAYKEYTEKNGTKTIDLLQDPALIAAWADQAKKAQEMLEWGYQQFRTWSEHSHQRHGGLEEWLVSMQEKIAYPEQLRLIAEEQAIFHKLNHIPTEELIID